MDIFTCIFTSLLLMVADGFTVLGPSAPLVAPLGSSVVLPCYVDELSLMEDLEVEWRRTDSQTLVHFFLEGESRPEAQQEDYRDRANFFTDQIQHGNFSIRLDNLRAGDEGRFTCTVHSGQDTGETVVQIKVQNVERLIVSGSNWSVSANDGEDVTLNCSVDSHITPEHIEEVSWIRTDGDENIPVLLYQNNETLSGSSDEQYKGRVEFFTDEIPKGNFSLRLKRVRTEDKGVYMCLVFAGDLSANATVVLEQLGFSSWHISVLFLCCAASSVAVLLLCALIYCRVKNTDTSRAIRSLQVSLVFCPNICMFLAFILWGFTEGFLHETITCSALYILRPVMLIWALHYLKYPQGEPNTWIRFFKIIREFTVFTLIVYSVLFAYGWKKSAHDTANGRRVSSGVCFGAVVVVLCLIFSGRFFSRPIVALVLLQLLQLSQFFQLISSFGLPSLAFVIVPIVQPLLLYCVPCLPLLQKKFKSLHQRWITLLWINTVTLLDIISVICILHTILEREKEFLEWICVIVFLELLKMTVFFENKVQEEERSRVPRRHQPETRQRTKTLHLCQEIMYMFGAVGLVLLNSFALTAELILKARNGERVLKDLRFVVFPSECVFVLWLIIQMHDCLNINTPHNTTRQRNSTERRHTRNTAETEMVNLSD